MGADAMSGFIPTTQVILLDRETGTDEYGDPIDVYRQGRRRVAAHIAEESVDVADPSSGTLMTVRTFKALLPGGLKVERGSRLRDLKDDAYYMVESVTKPSTFTGMSPLRCVLQLVTS